MSLPKVQIEIAQGNLGRIQPQGERMAIVHTAVAISNTFVLNKTYTIRSVKEAQDLGLGTGSGKNSELFEQIQDYYQVLGDGATLLVLGISKTTTFGTLTASNGALNALLESNPEVTLLGVNHLEYTSTHSSSPKPVNGGLSGNIHAGASALHGIADRFAQRSRPFHVILGGSRLSSFNSLTTYASGTHSRVSVLISSIHNNYNASVGFTLAYLGTLPVQRKLSRVRNGALPIGAAFFSNRTRSEDAYDAYEDLHTKRYLFIRTYAGRTGYYFADDLTLAQTSNDYATISSNRVLNKLIRISHEVFINEIGQEVLIEPNGELSAAAARYYETLIENAITLQMVNEGALSSIQAVVDERQKVLQTDELRVQLSAQPVGYTNTLRINIGFALATADDS